jgi:endonuclease/exonuclease/phosphatase (EEP) superfamily protein YafD
MISKCKCFEVANVCYANVAGRFATFTNLKYRPENFTWEWFVTNCGDNADLWLMTHNVKGRTPAVIRMAREYTREIAQNLVNNATK